MSHSYTSSCICKRCSLLTAAPDLLAALIELVEAYESVGGPLAVDPSVNQAKAAIIKARGRS